MALRFERLPSGFIRTETDPESRVFGDFLTTDVAHMPAVLNQMLDTAKSEQVIMDACHLKLDDGIVTIEHLYWADEPPFKASVDALKKYIAQWEAFLQSGDKELTIDLSK